MKGITAQNVTKRVICWLLLVVIITYGISGFGITEYRTVESLTFGLLTKSLAFKIHDSLMVPFIILLVLHITLSYIVKGIKGLSAGSS